MKGQIRGTLYQKNGYFYARVYYRKDGMRKTKDAATGISVDGGTKRKTEQNRRAAERFLAEHIASFEPPTNLTASGSTSDQMLADTARAWLEHQKGSKVPGTIAGYTYCVNDIALYFEQIHPIRTVDVKSSDVEKYLDWERMRRQPNYVGEHKVRSKYIDGSGIENTVKHRHTALRSILQYAKRDDLITKNVASKRDAWISVPEPQVHEFTILSYTEANAMVKALKSEPLWFQLAVRLGLNYGLRRSEVVGLRRQDIDWTSTYLHIKFTVTQQTVDHKNIVSGKPFTKNRKPKNLKMVLGLDILLQKRIAEQNEEMRQFGKSYDPQWKDHLICYPDGKLVSPNALTNKFKLFLHKNHLKEIRFHDLRHSCASFLLQENVDLKTIQEIMGHQQISTTMIYTHTLVDRTSDALSRMACSIVSSDADEQEVLKN